MVLKYLYPYWGSEQMLAEKFMNESVLTGFDGIEVNFPQEKSASEKFK